jgi:hypothetical protein
VVPGLTVCRLDGMKASQALRALLGATRGGSFGIFG